MRVFLQIIHDTPIIQEHLSQRTDSSLEMRGAQGKLSTTHFRVYSCCGSMLFELHNYVISPVYGFDDRFIDFLYHLESKIVSFLPV